METQKPAKYNKNHKKTQTQSSKITDTNKKKPSKIRKKTDKIQNEITKITKHTKTQQNTQKILKN